MRTIYLLILVGLVWGCTNSLHLNDSESITYIDYSDYQDEKLTKQDRLLLENVDFQEGILICLLDMNSAQEQGVSEKKYNYFLEYLQNENQRIEGYLEEGAIVFYNGKPFTKNEELYQYVETTEQPQTRTDYYTGMIYEQSFRGGMGNFEQHCGFSGPSKITTSMSGKGKGTLYLREELKGLTAYLVSSGMNSATFKWGFGDNGVS